MKFSENYISLLKAKGCNELNDSEYSPPSLRKERDRALFESYTKAIRERNFKSQAEAINYARLQPAPRFYIDGVFARMVINNMRKGEPMGVTGYYRVLKFQELYRRFMKEKDNPKYAGKPSTELCDIIVEQPAPEFYVSYRSARLIIARQREEQWLELKKKARR